MIYVITFTQAHLIVDRKGWGGVNNRAGWQKTFKGKEVFFGQTLIKVVSNKVKWLQPPLPPTIQWMLTRC